MHKTFQAFHLPVPMLGIVASLVVVGMLMLFHSVVQGAVQDGEFRRQALATKAAAAWRCSMVRDLPARQLCLLKTDVVAQAI